MKIFFLRDKEKKNKDVATMRISRYLAVCLPVLLGQVCARPGLTSPASRPHSLDRPSKRRNGKDESHKGCDYSVDVAATAPKVNIFQSLTDKEYADVTAFLHKQEELNLTAIVNSTS